MVLVVMVLMGLALVVLMLYLFIDWEGILRKRFENDITKGMVLVKQDGEYKPCKGKLAYLLQYGSVYDYEFGGMLLNVIVTEKYPLEWYKGRRLIVVKAGCSVAGQGIKREDSPDVSMVSVITKSQVFTELVNSLTGKSGLPLKWIVIVGIAALAAFFIFSQMGGCGQEEVVPEQGQEVPAEFYEE